MRIAQISQQSGLASPLSRLEGERERLLVIFERPSRVTEAGINHADLIERGNYAQLIFHGATDFKGATMGIQRLLGFSGRCVNMSKQIQSPCLASLISDLLPERESTSGVLKRRLYLAKPEIKQPYVVYRSRFAVAVAHTA